MKTSSPSRRRRPCAVESLEARTLFSSAFLAGGTLVVLGDDRTANRIGIDYTDAARSTVQVKVAGTDRHGASTFLIKTFPAASFGGVCVRGGAGADDIEVGDDGIAFDKATWIDCGTGDDVVASNDAAGGRVFVTGGPGDKTIFLGNGDDTVWGVAGSEDVVAGDGNDTFVGLSGTQSVSAGGGHNTWYVRNRKDVPAGYVPGKDTLLVAGRDLPGAGKGAASVGGRVPAFMGPWR